MNPWTVHNNAEETNGEGEIANVGWTNVYPLTFGGPASLSFMLEVC